MSNCKLLHTLAADPSIEATTQQGIENVDTQKRVTDSNPTTGSIRY